MYRKNGVYQIASAPITSNMQPIVAKGTGETIQQVYNRLDPKPDILFNGIMYNMKTRKFANGIRIGDNIIFQANMGGHLLFARDGKYFIERHPNIEIPCDWAIEGVGMIHPYDVKNIESGIVTGKHERTTIGFNKEVIKVISTTSEVTFNDLGMVSLDEGLTFHLNLDGGGGVGLIADGVTLINSTRANMNYVAIYYPKKPVEKHIFILDAGHEADTAGKRTPDGSLREFHFNDPVTKGVGRELLKYENVEVYYSNKDDTNDSLTDRTDFANFFYNKYKNEIQAGKVKITFISFHANASEDYDEVKDGWYDKAGGISTFVYGFRFTEAYGLAKSIQSELVKATGLKDRGTKEEDFHVLRETLMTSVLIEHAFMTNRAEAELLKSDSFRQKCIEADTKGIVNYYGLKKVELPQIKSIAKVTYQDKTIKAYLNDENRTVAEVRQLAELLGHTVNWDNETQTVIIR